MSEVPLTEEWVDQRKIREVFNHEHYYERLQAGEFHASVHNNSIHLSRRLARARQEPRCTRSQMVSYYDVSGRKVAVVHQYRRRDGRIGGSGKPDPKWLRIGEKVYWTD